VDARLHHLQGKAEHVSPVLTLLLEFYREKLDALLRHQAGSLSVAQYDINNTYQYIIAREEVQLSWLATAIGDQGGSLPSDGVLPDRGGKRRGEAAGRTIAEEDARDAQAFVDRWRPRVEAMSHARHRGMLRVILGETLEQKRFFEQAAAGRTDLLGKRSEHAAPPVGQVLPVRWIE
jgi:hypothetical protein